MTSMLNLVNTMPDSKAEYLRDLIIDEDNHRLDLYVSHNNELIALGYEDDNLVWFSVTTTSDMFLSRRIFESMRESRFYRRVPLADALSAANLKEKDLEYMCYIRLDNVRTDNPVFSGCIVGNGVSGKLTGVDFANILAVFPLRFRESITKIGSEDDIYTELEKDYQKITSLPIASGIESDMVSGIHEKWHKAECVKFCARASVRGLYHDVCYSSK